MAYTSNGSRQDYAEHDETRRYRVDAARERAAAHAERAAAELNCGGTAEAVEGLVHALLALEARVDELVGVTDSGRPGS